MGTQYWVLPAEIALWMVFLNKSCPGFISSHSPQDVRPLGWLPFCEGLGLLLDAKNKLRVKELEEREIALTGNVIPLLDILCIHMLVLKEMKKYQCFHFNLQFIRW